MKYCLRILGLLVPVMVMQFSLHGQTPEFQGKPVPANFCINASVMELYNMITEYRQQHDLPPVQLSKSLCYVAALHVRDLALHHPDQGGCNFHSWSGKGGGKPFCYPRDENKKNSVWDKPRELTTYPAKALEIVYWENTTLVNDSIFMVWKTEEYFNSFLLNTGKWQGKTWNAIGIAVSANYACAWFGEAPDPEGNAWVCGSIPENHAPDSAKSAVIIKKSKPLKTKPVAHDSVPVNHAVPVTPGTAGPAQKPATKNDTVARTWYIIVKTNLSPDAAGKLVNSLKAADYPGAKVLRQDDKIRVSVFESPSKPEATAKLREVKKTYKDAWLLKK